MARIREICMAKVGEISRARKRNFDGKITRFLNLKSDR